jgi:hypothetical protein
LERINYFFGRIHIRGRRGTESRSRNPAFFDHAEFCGCGINPAKNPAGSCSAKYFEKKIPHAGSRKCDFADPNTYSHKTHFSLTRTNFYLN